MVKIIAITAHATNQVGTFNSLRTWKLLSTLLAISLAPELKKIGSRKLARVEF